MLSLSILQDADSDDEDVVSSDQKSASVSQSDRVDNATPEITVTLTVSRTLVAFGCGSLAAGPNAPTTAASPPPSHSLATPQQQVLQPTTFDDLASGMLEKKGGLLRGWKQYFCVVKNGELSYYKKEADATAGKPPRKFYLLKGSVVRTASLPGRQHAFEVVLFPSTGNEKVLTFSATVTTFESWFAAFSRGAQTAASGGHVVARIVEFSEIPPLKDHDDQTSILLAPFTATVGIAASSGVTIKCVLEIEIVATHHVGTRIEKTTLVHLSPTQISFIVAPSKKHLSVTMESQAIDVTAHLPLLSALFATIFPPFLFENLVLLPLPKLLNVFKPVPQIVNPLLSIDIELKANIKHIAVRLPLAPPNSTASDSILIHLDVVASLSSFAHFAPSAPALRAPTLSRMFDASLDVTYPICFFRPVPPMHIRTLTKFRSDTCWWRQHAAVHIASLKR